MRQHFDLCPRTCPRENMHAVIYFFIFLFLFFLLFSCLRSALFQSLCRCEATWLGRVKALNPLTRPKPPGHLGRCTSDLDQIAALVSPLYIQLPRPSLYL
jgi:hypothetical protein